jgi:hypothetical protein
MGWFAVRTRVHIRRGSPRLFFCVSLFDIQTVDGTLFKITTWLLTASMICNDKIIGNKNKQKCIYNDFKYIK